MKSLLEALLLASVVLLAHSLVSAQTTIPTSAETIAKTSDTAVGSLLAEQLSLLEARKSFLERRLTTMSPTSGDHLLIRDWIHELNETIEKLKRSQTLERSSG